MLGIGRIISAPYRLIYSSMALAAVLPAPMARMTVAAPDTASPPAYTPGIDVAAVSSSTMMPPHFCVSRPGVAVAHQRVGRRAHRDDHRVHLDIVLRATGNGHRAAAARGVGLAELHFL